MKAQKINIGKQAKKARANYNSWIKKYQGVLATVGIVLVNDDGKILLEKRKNWPFTEYWCIPGGHIDRMEKASMSILRETREETGFIVKDLQFIGYDDEIIPGIKWHRVMLAFTGKAKGGKIKVDAAEVYEAKFFSPGEISRLRMAFNHKNIIKNFLKVGNTSKMLRWNK